MIDPEKLLISCGHSSEIVGIVNSVMPKLSPDVRKKLNRVKLHYLQMYGVDGLYARVNNRTVSSILAEHAANADREPLASGQLGDVKYELFDVPDSRPEEDKKNLRRDGGSDLGKT
jgi:hypothetical protein